MYVSLLVLILRLLYFFWGGGSGGWGGGRLGGESMFTRREHNGEVNFVYTTFRSLSLTPDQCGMNSEGKKSLMYNN